MFLAIIYTIKSVNDITKKADFFNKINHITEEEGSSNKTNHIIIKNKKNFKKYEKRFLLFLGSCGTMLGGGLYVFITNRRKKEMAEQKRQDTTKTQEIKQLKTQVQQAATPGDVTQLQNKLTEKEDSPMAKEIYVQVERIADLTAKNNKLTKINKELEIKLNAAEQENNQLKTIAEQEICNNELTIKKVYSDDQIIELTIERVYSDNKDQIIDLTTKNNKLTEINKKLETKLNAAEQKKTTSEQKKQTKSTMPN